MWMLARLTTQDRGNMIPAQLEALTARLKSPNRYDQIYADRLCAEAASALAALRDENAALRLKLDEIQERHRCQVCGNYECEHQRKD